MQGQVKAAHILHLITVPDILESGTWPHSLQTSEKSELRGEVSVAWFMVITTKRLVQKKAANQPGNEPSGILMALPGQDFR